MKLSDWRSTWPRQAPDTYIAVDPGETTGVALWWREEPDWIILQESSPIVVSRFLTGPYEPGAAGRPCVFSERFDIGGETVRLNPPMDSLYLNGWFAVEYGPNQYTEIGRADAKGFTSNAKLKHFGWWQKGLKGHAHDAARVLAFAMVHYNEPWMLEKLESYMVVTDDED